jgi:DNA-directed RNA polymerase specialized sigma24 family protein
MFGVHLVLRFDTRWLLPSPQGGAMTIPSQFYRSVRQLPSENWDRRSERWGRLMAAEKAGEARLYEQLLRELDIWLRRYYARRLPPTAAEDAKQEALMAIHANRHQYTPSRPFGAWVTAIARYKWIDRIRDASRFKAIELDEQIFIEDHVRRRNQRRRGRRSAWPVEARPGQRDPSGEIAGTEHRTRLPRNRPIGSARQGQHS